MLLVPLLSNLVADLLLKGKNFAMPPLALEAGPWVHHPLAYRLVAMPASDVCAVPEIVPRERAQ